MKIKNYLLAITILASFLVFLPGISFAADPGCYTSSSSSGGYTTVECPQDKQAEVSNGKCFTAAASSQGVGEFIEKPCDSFTSLDKANVPGHISLDNGASDADKCNGADLNQDNCTMIKYLVNGINFLSGVAGIAITFSLIFAGYQYIASRDNPQMVTSAKNRIFMAVVALLFFIFMYAILNWLIPGGLF